MSYDDPIPARPFASPEGDQPEWTLVSVADPDGQGADGAYTDGLARFGLPELVLWARPTQGDDPGADWLLTHDDRMAQLNTWANELLAGLLSPDEVQYRSFDHGNAHVTYRFGPPERAAAAGVDHLPPGVLVIVVGWSLTRRRTAMGAPDPASPGMRRVSKWLARAEAITAGWRARQVPVREAPAAATSRSEHFGPLSHWVVVRIGQLLGADHHVLAEFFERIPAAALLRCETSVHPDLLALASRHGRGGAAREVINASQFLVPALTDEPSPWQALVDEVTRAFPPDAAEQVRDLMIERLGAAIESLLLAAVVADLASPQLMADACGCWEWAVRRGQIPGRAWLAPAQARAVTRSLLTGPGGENLLIPLVRASPAQSWQEEVLAAQWGLRDHAPDLFGRADPDAGVLLAQVLQPSAADRVTGLITGVQTISAASARPGWLLAPGERSRLTRAQVRLAEGLAAPLLAAISHPTLIEADTWALITAPLRPHVPDLPEQAPGWGVLV